MRELAALAQAIRPPRAQANAAQLAWRSYRLAAEPVRFEVADDGLAHRFRARRLARNASMSDVALDLANGIARV